MTKYDTLHAELVAAPRRWFVTGAAGFIGSHLVETLLALNQHVIGIDNFVTGRRENLNEIQAAVGAERWGRFDFVEADIADNAKLLAETCQGADYVLHQAALGSVPRSIANPEATHRANVTGFLNVLTAAKDAKVRRFVYASSSSVYGDDPELPKVEKVTGRPLSPYAATKMINELYAGVFARVYGLEAVGLRYFNVFGPRQDPMGQYAAVIPQWVLAMLHNQPAAINGDGSISRDFCYIANTVQANLLAATSPLSSAHEVYNVALNARTTLNELFELIRSGLAPAFPHLEGYQPTYRPNRPGDIMHSQANIDKARTELGYAPMIGIADGISVTLKWYQQRYSQRS
jgi:UDP-N-acetylglucosamine 4-epimerase